MQIQSLCWKDPLEEEMAAHSSILALENPMDRGAWQATVHQVVKSQTTLRLNLHTHTHTHTSTLIRYIPIITAIQKKLDLG